MLQYVLDMLKKYGMTARKPVATPMEQNAKLRANIGEVLEDPTMYRKIVGSLIYATLTRPNMLHDVGVLSQFMQVPKKPHLDAARRVLHYAKSMLNFGLFVHMECMSKYWVTLMLIGQVCHMIGGPLVDTFLALVLAL